MAKVSQYVQTWRPRGKQWSPMLGNSIKKGWMTWINWRLKPILIEIWTLTSKWPVIQLIRWWTYRLKMLWELLLPSSSIRITKIPLGLTIETLNISTISPILRAVDSKQIIHMTNTKTTRALNSMASMKHVSSKIRKRAAIMHLQQEAQIIQPSHKIKSAILRTPKVMMLSFSKVHPATNYRILFKMKNKRLIAGLQRIRATTIIKQQIN